VDVIDQRQVSDGYAFRKVDGVRLPFATASFDVVISNHVIEHVGARESQRQHLAELARVLRHDGVGYLAVPNRWAPVEPHFGVPLLSWWPPHWRTPYLRLLGGRHYDCEPLGPRELDAMLDDAGFAAQAVEDTALQVMLELGELPAGVAACVKACPLRVRRALRPIMPTLIRRLQHVGDRGLEAGGRYSHSGRK
jgi:SAM-dependent methyltransferase